jgi:large conductance mechanosensitive channel
MSIVEELKSFIMKGEVIDLAVAVVIGVAFNTVINAFVTDIVTPLIGIPGHVNFASLTYTVNGSTFLVGTFINAVISFVTIALVVFFFIVKPVDKLKSLRQPKQAEAPKTKDCPECLSKIPIGAKRCAFCTAKLSG